MYYKKTIFITLLTALFLGIFFAAATVVHAPLQIFHKPWGRKTTFAQDMREQALGIIKHYDFESLILGNSLLENTSADEASEKIGGKFINLSSSGILYYERYTIASYALKKHSLKHVVLVFDANFSPNKLHSPTFIPKAYSDSIISQVSLYMNSKYAFCIALLQKSTKCVGKATALDMPNNWYVNNINLFGGYQNWLEHGNKKLFENVYHDKINPEQVFEERDAKNFEIIEKYLIALGKENLEVQFHIIIPPYHLLFWHNNREISYQEYGRALTFLTEKTSNLKNVKLYNFMNDEITSDISKYKDLVHYDAQTNARFLEAIAQRKHLLTLENLHQELKVFNAKVQSFKSKPYLDSLLKN
ncbi:MAG: hypothetical protein PHE89_02080 [Alphaproteobacteria bacterium]|nr:hypothetical protein [Alphaproteobacteria bacterium]